MTLDEYVKQYKSDKVNREQREKLLQEFVASASLEELSRHSRFLLEMSSSDTGVSSSRGCLMRRFIDETDGLAAWGERLRAKVLTTDELNEFMNWVNALKFPLSAVALWFLYIKTPYDASIVETNIKLTHKVLSPLILKAVKKPTPPAGPAEPSAVTGCNEEGLSGPSKVSG